MPLVLAREERVVLAYLCHEKEPWAHAAAPDEADAWFDRRGELIALVTFRSRAFYLGPPNDEAIRGHPLFARGLASYGVYEVGHSTWIRRLERMNAARGSHDPHVFAGLRHFVFTFHDSTFECIASAFTVVSHRSTLDAVVSEMQRLLNQDAPAA
jgi:hypothetical protein